jgi:hypothetical protein
MSLAFIVCLFLSGTVLAQVTVRMTADNFYAGYTGNFNGASLMRFSGAWPGVASPAPFTITASETYLYIAAWDDGSTGEGLLGSVAIGAGLVPTGSELWRVCATGQPLGKAASNAPTAAALTTRIGICNSSNGWHAPSAGPNNENALGAGLWWGKVNAIEPTANWIWDTNSSSACAGANGFLKGPCDPGEYLIFRVPLGEVAACLPPVPDFVIDWTAGYGALVANGTNSQNESAYFWSVQESDQWWNGLPPEINRWFLAGQAGVFDLRTFYEAGSTRHLKCGAYYRVKLAVSNRCVNWRDITRLVKINCCPGEVTAPK